MLRGTHPVDAAVVGRLLDRTQRVQADVEGGKARGERGADTGARASRRMREIPGVVGSGEYRVGPDLGTVGLTQEDSSGRLEPGRDGTVLFRDVIRQKG